jgi:hypothetical protein
MQHFFGTAAINFTHWNYILAATAIFFGLVELEKFLLHP